MVGIGSMRPQQKLKASLTLERSGFTIIEVVLVLAIAGLIFLIVFLALPGLQRSRRDTQRKSDVDQMVGQIISYESINSGSPPAGCGTSDYDIPTSSEGVISSVCNASGESPQFAQFINSYIKPLNMKDPSGGHYHMTHAFSVFYNATNNNKPGTIVVAQYSTCLNGSLNYDRTNNSVNDFAVWMWLENGSYCHAG